MAWQGTDVGLTADDRSWYHTENNIRWSMTDPGADPQGRDMMRHAAGKHDFAWMGQFKDGFHKSQSSPWDRAMFDACCNENAPRVYQIGEKYV